MTTSDRDLEAVERLKSEGVPESTARRLVADHGPEHCISHVEALNAIGPATGPPGQLRRSAAGGPPASRPDPSNRMLQTRADRA